LEFEREEREKKNPPKINHLTSIDTCLIKKKRTWWSSNNIAKKQF
jgi:hypothetical protein